MIASNGGVVDLSGVGSITGARDDVSTDPNWIASWLRFRVESGGRIDLSGLRSIAAGRVWLDVAAGGILNLGNLEVSSTTRIAVADPSAQVNVNGTLFLGSKSQFLMTSGASIRIRDDLLLNMTAESSFSADGGIVYMDGNGLQYLEAAGNDVGAVPATSANFELGRLVVGREEQATTVMVLDLFNNGNRGASGREAIYLKGVGGLDGLEITPGSRLVLNDINVYARQGGTWIHLNSLFSPGTTEVPFAGGILAIPEPSGLSLLVAAAITICWYRRR
ncbi:MAG: hypothetical protein DCC68_17740 [Planctomycetota bacterium]|nr:MAG: hypothetical protein DCC68_17740 [Planctomycetota bacterium]